MELPEHPLLMKDAFRDQRIWIICALFLTMSGIALNDVLVYNPDSARYLIWANSLSQLKGFEDTSILEPFHYVVHAPLYPVLLAPVALIFPSSVVAAKVLTLAAGAVLLFLFYTWLSRKVGKSLAVAGSAVLLVNPLMVLFSNQILSDVPFGVAAILAFLMVEEITTSSGERTRLMLALAGVITAGIFLREVGVTLYLAVVVFFIARREYQRALLVFLVPLIFYLLWFLRNEVIVAGTEHPPLRNSEIFTLRYFTSADTSLFAELGARLSANASLYWSHIVNLLFSPQYGVIPYGVMIRNVPPYSTIAPLVESVQYGMGLVSVALFLYGVSVSTRRYQSTGLFLSFVPIYLLLILFYPFNDVRFLFPLLLFMVYFATIGGASLVAMTRDKGFGTHFNIAGIFILGILLIPNAVWCYAFVRDNGEYRNSPLEFYESVASNKTFPDMLTKPTEMVGDWLENREAGNFVVMTQWKELTFWLPKGKLVEINPLVSLDEFERHIRDNDVRYIVSAVGLAGLPEFYSQMVLSNRFGFESVYRVANLEVFKILARQGFGRIDPTVIATDTTWMSPEVIQLLSEQEQARSMFASGVRALTRGELDSAKSVFERLNAMTGNASIGVLFLAIAHEFKGEYDRARGLFGGFRSMRQSGAFLGHAAYHQQIIDLLERAKWEEQAAARAELYHIASVKYWNLGFRRQAFNELGRSLASDSTFLPALVFGIYFQIEEGNFRGARSYFDRLNLIAPMYPLTHSFKSILAHADSLGRAKTPSARSAHRMGMADSYQEAGLGDSAINELLDLLREDPEHLSAWKLLVQLYLAKERYSPALRGMNRVVELDPNDETARAELQSLEERW